MSLPSKKWLKELRQLPDEEILRLVVRMELHAAIARSVVCDHCDQVSSACPSSCARRPDRQQPRWN